MYGITSVNGALRIGADLSNWKLVASVKIKGKHEYKHCIPLGKVSPAQ